MSDSSIAAEPDLLPRRLLGNAARARVNAYNATLCSACAIASSHVFQAGRCDSKTPVRRPRRRFRIERRSHRYESRQLRVRGDAALRINCIPQVLDRSNAQRQLLSNGRSRTPRRNSVCDGLLERIQFIHYTISLRGQRPIFVRDFQPAFGASGTHPERTLFR